MTRRRGLSDAKIAALKPRASRHAIPDPELGGTIRPGQSGRQKDIRRSVYTAIRLPGRFGQRSAGQTFSAWRQARPRCRSVIERIKKGLPAFEAEKPGSATFAEVAANWMRRHVEAGGFRSRRKIEGLLARDILPAWGAREIAGIRRSDLARLLDDVEDHRGARQSRYRPRHRAQRDGLAREARRRFRAAHRQGHGPAGSEAPGTRAHPQRRRNPLALECRRDRRRLRRDPPGGAVDRRTPDQGRRHAMGGTVREWRVDPRQGASRKGQRGIARPSADGARYHQVATRESAQIRCVFAGRGEGPFESWSRAQAGFRRRAPGRVRAVGNS